MKMKIWR